MRWLVGVVIALKPTLGLVAFAAAPSWAAAAVMGAITAVSFLVAPDWLPAWPGAIAGGQHPIPLLIPGGVLVLLALSRWRRPEARLLVAMACVPHTMSEYDTLPFLLIPKTLRQSVLMAVLVSIVSLAQIIWGPLAPVGHEDGTAYIRDGLALAGPLVVWLLYLPALGIVMRRPNTLIDEPVTGRTAIFGRRTGVRDDHGARKLELGGNAGDERH